MTLRIVSPGRARIVTVVRIDPDKTCLNLRRNPVGPRKVTRPDTRAKPVLARIRQFDAFRFVLYRSHVEPVCR